MPLTTGSPTVLAATAVVIALTVGSRTAVAQAGQPDIAIGRWVATATPDGSVSGGDRRLWITQIHVRTSEPHWSFVGEVDRLHGPDADRPDSGEPYPVFTDWSFLAGVRQE